MEGHECSITFYNEESESGEEVVGYLKCPFPPDVGDVIWIRAIDDEHDSDHYEVTKRLFHYPSPGSITYNNGGRHPIMDIKVKPAVPFFNKE